MTAIRRPPFSGEPYAVDLHDRIETTRDHYWDALNRENRVSLLVKFIHVTSGKTDLSIVNKHQE